MSPRRSASTRRSPLAQRPSAATERSDLAGRHVASPKRVDKAKPLGAATERSDLAGRHVASPKRVDKAKPLGAATECSDRAQRLGGSTCRLAEARRQGEAPWRSDRVQRLGDVTRRGDLSPKLATRTTAGNHQRMIVTIAGHKGGVGKTTLATNVATELMDRGWEVLLVDADMPQCTALAWAATGADREGAPRKPEVVPMSDDLHKKIRDKVNDYDHIVVDCPGRQDDITRAAIAISDVTLMPCAPSGYDIWGLQDTLDLFKEIKAYRPDLVGRFVIMKRDARTKYGKSFRESLSGQDTSAMKAAVSYRAAYVKSATQGTSVVRLAPESPAADEIRAIVDELLQIGPRTRRRAKRASKKRSVKSKEDRRVA